MRYFPFKDLATGMALVAVACVAALAQTPTGIGRAPTPEELQAVNKGTGVSGKDLPPGKGTAKDGARIFLVKCAMCHGNDAQGVSGAPGSQTTLRGGRLGGGNAIPLWETAPPDRSRITTGIYYWAYPTTLWNTIAIAMPQYNSGSLTPDEVYALSAYLLFKNGIIKEDAIMDRETLPKVELPNRHAFVPDKLEDLADPQNWDKRGCTKPYGVCP